MQPIKINKNYKLTKDVYDQILNLEKQGISRSKIGRLLKVNRSTMVTITKMLIDRGIWQKSAQWIKRENTLSNGGSSKSLTKDLTKNLTKDLTKDLTKKTISRKSKVENFITINFKGVNVQVEKSSNIIITQSAILVK
jgi:DNA-binding MarR family transcriptional regulator